MQAAQAYFDEIEEVTDGHVVVEGYYSAVLAGVSAVGDMVSSGGVDMGWIYTSYYPTLFTLSDVITLPLQGFGDNVAATNLLWDLYETVPEMAAQWDNEYKVLQLYANPAMKFMFSEKITTADQIKGLNIRCPAGAITDVLAAWGGSGITMGPPDIYEAMEKKNVDGYIFEEVGCNSFSLYEVTPYYLDMPMFVGAFSIACNWDSWNALPQEYQDAIQSISDRDASLASANAFKGALDDARAIAADAGVEFVTPTDAEIATWAVEADKYAASWAEGITSSIGIDGAAYLQNAKDIYAKYE
jgi:TRAP-type C4-dicarboxylate transport system substrate-binding protein